MIQFINYYQQFIGAFPRWIRPRQTLRFSLWMTGDFPGISFGCDFLEDMEKGTYWKFFRDNQIKLLPVMHLFFTDCEWRLCTTKFLTFCFWIGSKTDFRHCWYPRRALQVGFLPVKDNRAPAGYQWLSATLRSFNARFSTFVWTMRKDLDFWVFVGGRARIMYKFRGWKPGFKNKVGLHLFRQRCGLDTHPEKPV